MPVRIPVGWIQVDLDITDKTPPFESDFKDCLTKVGTRSEIPLAGIDDTDFLARRRHQTRRTKGAIIPNRLDMAFNDGFAPLPVKEAFSLESFHR